MSRPLAVAITGGIGAGTSEALAAFARHGAVTVSSDEVVHRLLREDEEVRQALLERFGDTILDGADEIDRSAIAEIVFADREALAWLEALLHPRVAAQQAAWRDELQRGCGRGREGDEERQERRGSAHGSSRLTAKPDRRAPPRHLAASRGSGRAHQSASTRPQRGLVPFLR